MFFEELWQYISNFMTIEEIILAGIGAIFIIIILILGGKEQEDMESINRKVDELGRVVIPIEFRRKLGIETKNNLTMLMDGDRIILEKGLEVDELGRIVIPFHIRKAMGIKEKEELKIEVVDEKIILNRQVAKKEE